MSVHLASRFPDDRRRIAVGLKNGILLKFYLICLEGTLSFVKMVLWGKYVISSVLSCHSKDLKQQTSATAQSFIGKQRG